MSNAAWGICGVRCFNSGHSVSPCFKLCADSVAVGPEKVIPPFDRLEPDCFKEVPVPIQSEACAGMTRLHCDVLGRFSGGYQQAYELMPQVVPPNGSADAGTNLRLAPLALEPRAITDPGLAIRGEHKTLLPGDCQHDTTYRWAHVHIADTLNAFRGLHYSPIERASDPNLVVPEVNLFFNPEGYLLAPPQTS